PNPGERRVSGQTLPHLLRLRRLRPFREGVRQPPHLAATRVAEVEPGWARFVRVAVGPEDEERIARMQRTARVAVVEFAAARELSATRPGRALVGARPKHHLAARAPLLRARF